ncbi:FAD synthase [Candidatus Woesearchaeota archaeon CG10_big_fil_rev_8_21_14_0_10_36_11]|nr:MAG: FAD synthase [Candidatus Woesearchaeota archaeon CG10_big_fil_rev_8_21_14_0_10_36_11]
MTTVMCFGTFDILHLGHINYFQQAKMLGDLLIVVIARDATKQHLNKKTLFSENERVELVQAISCVTKVVLGDTKDHLKVIENEKPDFLCLGYDQDIKETVLHKMLMERNLFPKIVRMKPYKENKYKSSIIKKIK